MVYVYDKKCKSLCFEDCPSSRKKTGCLIMYQKYRLNASKFPNSSLKCFTSTPKRTRLDQV